MKVSKIIAISVVCAGIALVACRREERYEPLKLGADANVEQQAAAR